MNLIILGAPGSGKGTQAEMLSKKLGLFYLQTGDLAREWAKKDERIKEIIESGKLIPEAEMTDYVMKYLEKNVPEGKDILFEGFPRFISQYEKYEEWLNSKNQKLDKAISLYIDEKVAIQRLSSRRLCEKCKKVYNLITNPPAEDGICECGGNLIQRKDDMSQSIKVRFEYYKDNTKKLVDYLNDKGKLLRINADRPINIIFEDILTNLEVINA